VPIAPAAAKAQPAVVLPYTGAVLWPPVALGSALLGLGAWLRRLAGRLEEE
jgi:hypothetical protein